MPPCGRRGALPEVAPSVSINNPAPYRPCAGQANFLGNEAAARRPMGIHMCTVRMPITPTYRGPWAWRFVAACRRDGVAQLPPVKGRRRFASVLEDGLEARTQRETGAPTARRASAPRGQSSTGPFGECKRVRRCSVVEMLETSDGEQPFCHRPTSLRAIIFLRVSRSTSLAAIAAQICNSGKTRHRASLSGRCR